MTALVTTLDYLTEEARSRLDGGLCFPRWPGEACLSEAGAGWAVRRFLADLRSVLSPELVGEGARPRVLRSATHDIYLVAASSVGKVRADERGNIAILLGDMRPLGADPMSALREVLGRVLAPPVMDGGAPLPAEGISADEHGISAAILPPAHGGLAGGRYERLLAHFDGRVLLVHLEPFAYREPNLPASRDADRENQEEKETEP